MIIGMSCSHNYSWRGHITSSLISAVGMQMFHKVANATTNNKVAAILHIRACCRKKQAIGKNNYVHVCRFRLQIHLAMHSNLPGLLPRDCSDDSSL